MRVMVLVKATEDSEAGTMPSTEMLEAMGKYNEELVDAGELDRQALRGRVEVHRVVVEALQICARLLADVGAALGEPEWRAVFRQLVAFGYLTVDHEGFGSLVLTEASKPVLKGEQNVTMRRYVKPTRTRQSSGRTSERADPTIGMGPRERARA